MAISFEGREKFEKGIEDKLLAGEQRDDIAAELVALGWPPEDAASLVARLHQRCCPDEANREQEARDQAARRAGCRQMIAGTILLAIGLPLSVLVYMGASSTSTAIPILVHFPLLAGGFLLYYGVTKWTKARWGSGEGARYWTLPGSEDRDIE